jgi:signal transduction histidine kinase/CheY-like chemotaxis protein/HPt (histidine-containing phosphotransfer) domain-containing protein
LNLQRYVEAEKRQVLGVLANYNFGQTGRLYVFSRQGEAVMQSANTETVAVPIERIIGQKSGTIRFAHDGQNHFGVYQTTTHWDWVIVLSLAESELFASRNFYLKLVLMFFLLILAAVMILSTWMAGSFRQRIDAIVDNIKQAEQGNLTPSEVSIPADELGAIQRGFNAMISTVAAHANALETAKEQAEAANRSKSEFLARMSHEIRTPLNAVVGLNQVVLKSDLTEAQRDYLEKALLASNNLMQVINEILDFSKVEAGQLTLTPAFFDLDLILEHLADLFNSRVSQKDIELIFSKSPQVPAMLMGDAGRLSQVLTNLIENAVKFTETGEVFVGVELNDASGAPSGQVVLKFRVSDTGMGIAADMLPTLFDPFVQADSSLTRKHEGTGLGLAISRRLVELMDGRIWTESAPGRGSTFYFTVLLGTQKSDKPQLSIPVDLHGLRALLVDRSDASGRFLRDLLKSFTLNVSSVQSGEKAIDELCKAGVESPYRLVLLNWKLPGMDGITTARRIRQLEYQGQTVTNRKQQTAIVLMVTSYALEQMQARIDTAPVDTYLLKPVKSSQLFNTIMKMFSGSKAVLPPVKAKRAKYDQPLAGHRVLVVEDSILNRDVAVALLTQAGLVVETTENGRAAVEKVTTGPMGYFDAVLMDIQMPLMDGYEATRRIRAWEFKVQSSKFNLGESQSTSGQPETGNPEPGNKLPIIALTAHALKGEKEKCLAAGMDDYIPKPIDELHLRQVLRKWISHRKEREGSVTQPPDRRLPHDLAVLDVQGALGRLGGREHLYLKVVRKFIPEFGQAPEAIADDLAAGEVESAKRTAHNLNGTAAGIGAMALSQAADNAEKAISGEAADRQEALAQLKNELEKVRTEISAYLDKKTSSPQSIAAPVVK